MILLYGLLLGVLAGLLTRGRLTALANHRLRAEELFVVFLLVQLLAPRLPLELSETMLLRVFWTLPAIGCLLIALINLREPGFLLVATGLALNILVVTLNSGMPVLTANAELTGASVAGLDAAIAESWLHIPAGINSTLLWITDVIPVPGPSWHRGLISLGDVLLSMGVGLYVFVRMHEEASNSTKHV